jgi:hypothetical protein
MKNIFEIIQEEKSRILGMHELATKKHYLMEATGFNNFPCVSNHPKAKVVKLNDGTSSYEINGVYYYGNGRKKLANGTMANYTCNDAEFKSTQTTNQTSSQSPKLDNTKVTEIQTILKTKGVDLGKSGPKQDGVDGVLGSKTLDAILNVLKSNNSQTPAPAAPAPTQTTTKQ